MQLGQPQHHFFQRRIAGALAQAVHRGVGVGGAAATGGQGVGGGQAQVVVGVDFNLQPAGRAQGGNPLVGGERLQNAQRVGKAQPARAGLGRHLGQLAQKPQVSARGVFTAHAHLHAQIARARQRVR